MSGAAQGEHLAAVLSKKGADLIVMPRPTPAPGPKELLLEVKAVALNNLDRLQRETGFPPVKYPCVLGSDVAGVVVAAGADVPADAPQPGTRVAAFAPALWVGKPDYGAFQERVLVPWQNAVPLPDSITYVDATTLPMGVQTVWCALKVLFNIPHDLAYTAPKNEAFLVWSAASGVGTSAVQVARALGFSVYAVASAKHHEYITSLGAARVFDYRDPGVVASVVAAVKQDGLTLEKVLLTMGDTQPCVDILKALGAKAGRVAVTPFSFSVLLSTYLPWTYCKFVQPPGDLHGHFGYAFGVWLKQNLASGGYVPSPKARVLPGGLAGLQAALGELKGASGEKLVVEI